jgi:hypothetical protein
MGARGSAFLWILELTLATSGTVSQTTFTTGQIIDTAFRYCRVPPATVSGEMIDTALSELFLILSSYAALGLQLWAVDKQITSLTQYQSAYPTPSGTIDVQSAFTRSVTVLSGSQAGGDSQQIMDLGGDVVVSTVGVAFAGNATTALIVSTSSDGVTYTTARSIASATYGRSATVWFDFDPSASCRYVRVTGTGLTGATLQAANNPYEIPITRIGQDDYVAMPNKTTAGAPVMFWLDRQAVVPVMRLWPVPDASSASDQLVIWRQRYIQDVGTMQQTLELPQRWLSAVAWKLAFRLCFACPLVDKDMAAQVGPVAKYEEGLILGDERDSAPMSMASDFSAYTA